MSGKAERAPKSASSANPIMAHRSIALVVGAHPLAERDDRPTIQDLAQALEHALAVESDRDRRWSAQVMTDLWFLSDASLVSAPCIALGRIETNAVVAHLATRLPQAMVIDGDFEIQLDATGGDPRACIRGIDRASTLRAVREFQKRFMTPFLESIGAIAPAQSR